MWEVFRSGVSDTQHRPFQVGQNLGKMSVRENSYDGGGNVKDISNRGTGHSI